MIPAPYAKPIVNPATNVIDVYFSIPSICVNGAKRLENMVNQPFSRKNCITIINSITITANCTTATPAVWIAGNVISPQPVGITSVAEVKPYCAGSDPPFQSKLIHMAASKARASRIPEINHQLTPTLEATVDSINKLWEKESITARINTSFTEKSNEIIAAIPAYRFKAFPRTKGTAASPDKP